MTTTDTCAGIIVYKRFTFKKLNKIDALGVIFKIFKY